MAGPHKNSVSKSSWHFWLLNVLVMLVIGKHTMGPMVDSMGPIRYISKDIIFSKESQNTYKASKLLPSQQLVDRDYIGSHGNLTLCPSTPILRSQLFVDLNKCNESYAWRASAQLLVWFVGCWFGQICKSKKAIKLWSRHMVEDSGKHSQLRWNRAQRAKWAAPSAQPPH